MFLCLQDPTKITSDITSDPNAGPQLVIWGTDVVVSQCKEKFRRFISKYLDKNVAGDEQFDGMDINEPYYLQRLEEVRRTFENKFIIEKNRFKHGWSTIPLISTKQTTTSRLMQLNTKKTHDIWHWKSRGLRTDTNMWQS